MLRPYQQAAIDSLYDWFREKKGNPLIVCPTGAGKSHIIAEFAKGVLEKWHGQRILVVSHRKEILEQNADKILAAWPGAPLTKYGASLGEKRVSNLCFAQIQSAWRRPEVFGKPNLVIVDEAHLIPKEGEGMYITFIDALKKVNPKLKVIGLTATPMRMKCGFLFEGDNALFDGIAYDIDINTLIKDGYLAPLVSKNAITQGDLSCARVRGGEFMPGDAEAAMDRAELTESAISEMLRFGGDRKSWLIFCSGVDHAQHVYDALSARCIAAATIHANTPPVEREQLLRDFKSQKLQALCNVDVLTTGFDAPCVDLIAVLRPTHSVGLWVQMLGRGMRLSPGTKKKDALVLDFAGNIDRHGPIDCIRVKKGKDGEGASIEKATTKTCPECRNVVNIFLRDCPECGYEFAEAKPQHDATASDKEVISGKGSMAICSYDVDDLRYALHEKKLKLGEKPNPPTLRIEYMCGLERIYEWVCIEHAKGSYPQEKAAKWWRQRSTDPTMPVPTTVEEAVKRANMDELRVPLSIVVRPDGAWKKLISITFPSTEQMKEKEKQMEEILAAFV